MANETHSGSGSVGYSIPAPVESAITAETREALVSAVFARMVEFSEPGLAKIFPRATTVPAVAGAAGDPSIANGATEEDAVTPTTLVLTNPTATVGIRQTAILQSDLSIAASAANWFAENPQFVGRALADKMDVDVMFALAGFTNVAGSTGVDCTLEDLRAAATLLRLSAKGSAEGAVFVLHPQQIADIEALLISGAGAGVAALVHRPDFISMHQGNMGSGALSEYRGHILGIPVFQSGNVYGDGTDRKGGLVVPGQAIAMVYKWLARIKQSDQAVNFQAAQSWMGTSCYGVVELNDDMGVTIQTDQ